MYSESHHLSTDIADHFLHKLQYCIEIPLISLALKDFNLFIIKLQLKTASANVCLLSNIVNAIQKPPTY